MSGQIIFFEKSQADFTQPGITATASQGASYASYALNRNPSSAWITTGSVDADGTTWEVTFPDAVYITDILLVKHNFKNFTVKYWDGSAYQDFSTAISETTNTATTNRYHFNSVQVYKIKITINGTMIANEDKYLFQFVATNLIGQLDGWPLIKDPTISKNKKNTKMLSGRYSVAENVSSFSCKLKVKNWKLDADLDIVESLYDSNQGFLVWLCGGSEAQFSSIRKGYRLEDIPLMRCGNDYSPEFVEGLYKTGLDIEISLIEVVE